ncbi:protein-export chaperone SecB [Pseudidiomarina marina]|uniref:hypothetical protein n=1 Tax=Pseudidiomarina marina TaxID=502366 RepID=UPI00384B15A7
MEQQQEQVDSNKPKIHPIQLIDVKVRRLHVDLLRPVTENVEVDIKNFTFSHSHSKYNEETKTFIVMASAEIGIDDNGEIIESEDNIVAMRVDIAGFFKVDEEKFPKQHVETFAERNAPLIVYPFLREQTYGLLSKAGINGVVLPLFHIQPIKFN